MERFAWYIGPIALLLAVIGLAVLLHRIVRTPRGHPALVLFAIAGPTAVLYFWQPHIYPDQPWMMRRYLPAILPVLLIAAGVAGDALTDVSGRLVEDRRRSVMAATSFAVALALVFGPLQVSWPSRSLRWQAGGYAGMAELCDAVGPDATIIVTNHNAFGILLVPSIRAMCRIPTARPHPHLEGEPLPLHEIRERVEASGNRLWVLGATPERIEKEFPGAGEAREITILDTTQLVSTLAYPPGRTTPRRLVVHVAPVDA